MCFDIAYHTALILFIRELGVGDGATRIPQYVGRSATCALQHVNECTFRRR